MFERFKSADYLCLETSMMFSIDEQGTAAVKWMVLKPHPTLSEVQAKIALACLQYGRILSAHRETQEELFRRVEVAARSLMSDDCVFRFDDWVLQVGSAVVRIWPRDITTPDVEGFA